MRLSRWIFAFAVLIVPTRAMAEPILVTVAASGPNEYTISLLTRVQAAQTPLWNVLTDYDHHAGFLPYMILSRVIEKRPDYKLVEQAGRIRILFWTFTMRVQQKVHEDPPTHMHFQAVDGDFSRLEGDWTLTPVRENSHMTSLGCLFHVRPKRRVPEWAVRLAAKHYLATMVRKLQERAEGKVP